MKKSKQINAVLNFMLDNGGITNVDAEKLGVKNLSAVICRIRKRGHEVDTMHVTEIITPTFWQWLRGKRPQNIDRRMYVLVNMNF